MVSGVGDLEAVKAEEAAAEVEAMGEEEAATVTAAAMAAVATVTEGVGRAADVAD